MPNELVVSEIRKICQRFQELAPERLRIVRGEEDESTDPATDAADFLKLDGKRISRDFQLYGLMARIGGVQDALSDFSYVFCILKKQTPRAYEDVKPHIQDWDKHFEEKLRADWRAMWA